MSHRGQLNVLNNGTPVAYHSHTMGHSSHSHSVKMPSQQQPQRTASQDSTAESIRKRVCKACDRCRLKKSKCDGSNPCSRCKADNAICVFGERKKTHDRVYPKGYVEMLEQQQSQLVSGLQEMYRRLLAGDMWDGETLSDTNGSPLTHDILAALGLLESKQDGSGEMEMFEEDCQKLQSKLIAEGAGYTQQRRGSFSSDSEHSQHGHGRADSLHGTPTLTRASTFKSNSIDFSAPPTPLTGSPLPLHRSQAMYQRTQSPIQQQAHQQSPLANDPQFYQAEWAYPQATGVSMMQSAYALHTPSMDQSLSAAGDMISWEASQAPYDAKFDMNNINMASLTSFPPQLSNMPGLQDGTTMDPMMEVEFNQFIQVMT